MFHSKIGNTIPTLVQRVLDLIPTAIAVFGIDGHAVFLNQTFKQLHGITTDWTKDDLTLKARAEAGAFGTWKEDPGTYFEGLREKLLQEGEYQGQVELGERVLSIQDMLIAPDLLLTIQQDITEQVKSAKLSEHLAHHDQLTDLPNRSKMACALDEAIAGASVQKKRFALLVADLDHFRDVNDLYGDAGGDVALRMLATRFNEAIGPDEQVARLGGDEFAFLCESGKQPEAAADLAGRLLGATESPIELDGQSCTIGLAIGVAIYPDDGEDRRSLLKSAQAALFRAKADGRGSVRTFDPATDKRIHEQRQILHDLHQAVAKGQLELHFQPQADMGRSIFGFESLVRWRHPDKGLIPPDAFIPLAEQSNLIIEIGEWVLRNACREAASWKHPLGVAVNLSPSQVRLIDVPDLVQRILTETGLEPHRLELEITEGVLIDDSARASHVLCRLKEMGVRIAMDDFGTGYSSLSYLQAFPFDKLKIDKCFIRDLTEVRQSQEIVRAIVGLGRGLEMPVLAEGVETEAQMNLLRSIGCQSVQGYLIGRPLPISAYIDFTSSDWTQPVGSVELAGSRDRHMCSSEWLTTPATQTTPVDVDRG